jgi:hypothetical protein
MIVGTMVLLALSTPTRAIAADSSPTSITWMTPINGAYVSGDAYYTFSANDADGMCCRRLLIDGLPMVTSPYIGEWHDLYGWKQASVASFWYSWKVEDGPHVMQVEIKDLLGNIATSSGVTIIVDNTAPPAPTGLTANAHPRTGVMLSWNVPADVNGIWYYFVYRNGAVIGQPTTNSFTDTTTERRLTYEYRIVAVDMASLLSATSAPVTVRTK